MPAEDGRKVGQGRYSSDGCIGSLAGSYQSEVDHRVALSTCCECVEALEEWQSGLPSRAGVEKSDTERESEIVTHDNKQQTHEDVEGTRGAAGGST